MIYLQGIFLKALASLLGVVVWLWQCVVWCGRVVAQYGVVGLWHGVVWQGCGTVRHGGSLWQWQSLGRWAEPGCKTFQPEDAHFLAAWSFELWISDFFSFVRQFQLWSLGLHFICLAVWTLIFKYYFSCRWSNRLKCSKLVNGMGWASECSSSMRLSTALWC